MNPYDDNHLQERRIFISNTLKTVGAAALVSMVGPLSAHSEVPAMKDYTVQEIIDIILKEIPGAPFKQTIDTLKSGNAEMKVTGVITTMFATVEIIRQAIKLNANFIIAHEPTFYNHADDPNWVADNDVVKMKQELLNKHNIAVWRCHDYWHAYRPDGISNGVLKKAGWVKYGQPGNIVEIPATKLKNLVDHLKTSLQIKKVRVIGDPAQSCKRLALLPGAWGGQRQIATTEKEKPDVLIVGEVHEWETAEYIRDARALGRKVSLIILGHSVSEEPGMEWMAEWLRPRLEGVKVTHASSGDPFVWL